MCFPNVTGGSRVNKDDYKFENKTQVNDKTQDPLVTDESRIKTQDKEQKTEDNQDKDKKISSTTDNAIITNGVQNTANNAAVDDKVATIGARAVANNSNNVSGSPTSGVDSSKGKTDNTVTTDPKKRKEELNKSFQNIKNIAEDLKGFPEIQELIREIEKNSVHLKEKNDIDVNDLEPMKKLQSLISSKITELNNSGRLDSKMKNIKSSLDKMNALTERMIPNLEAQKELYTKVDTQVAELDKTVAEMKAKIETLPIGSKERVALESLVKLYETTKNPATKVLMSNFMKDIINTMNTNPIDMKLVLSKIDKFCGVDEVNGKVSFKKDSVMGRLREAQDEKTQNGKGKRQNLIDIMSEYDPANADVYKAMLSRTYNPTLRGEQKAAADATVSSDELNEIKGLGGLTYDERGVGKTSTSTSRASSSTKVDDNSDDDSDLIPEDYDALADKAKNVRTSFEVLADDPIAIERLSNSGVLSDLQNIANTKLTDIMNKLRMDSSEINKLQEEMLDLIQQFNNTSITLNNDINKIEEGSKTDLDSVIRESADSFIKQAEELEASLDLEVTGVPDITSLLQKLRSIITTLDRELNVGYKKSNEKKMGEIREFNKELREKLENIKEQKEQEQLKVNDKVNEEKNNNKFLDKKFMDKLNKLSEALVNIDIVSNFRNKVA